MGRDLNYVVTGLIRAATPNTHIILSTVIDETVRHCLRVQLATGYGQEGIIVVEPFRIHVADEVLDDLRARLTPYKMARPGARNRLETGHRVGLAATPRVLLGR